MRKLKLFLAGLILTAICIPVTYIGAATGDPGMIYDFSTQANFDEYYDNLSGVPEECEIDWKNNMMHMVATGADPRVSFMSVEDDFECGDYPWMKIGVLNPTDSTVFEMHYKIIGIDIDGSDVVQFPISSKDTARKDYVVNIPERNIASAAEINSLTLTETTWDGGLEYIRLDCLFFAKPSGEVPVDTEFYVEYVAFFKTKEEADAFNISTYRTAGPATSTATPTPTATPTQTTAAATTAAATTAASTSSASSTATVKTDDKDDNNNTGLIIGIAAAVVLAGGGIAFAVIKMKKK